MLANSQYDILLNSKGYLLVEESRRKKAQQAFSPRFSTGDPSYTDLSYWQFLAQESWVGGEGQDILSALTKYKQSSGWDTRADKPRLGFGYSQLTLLNNPPAPAAGSDALIFDDFEADLSKWSRDAGIQIETYLSGRRCANVNSSIDDDVNQSMWTAQTFAYGTWRLDMATTLTSSPGTDGAYAEFWFLRKSNADSYRLIIKGSSMGTWVLVKQVNGIDTTLATLTATGYVDQFTQVKVVRENDGTFTVYQDGVSLGSVIDAEITTCDETRFVLLNGFNQVTFAIDNVYFPTNVAQGNAGAAAKAVLYDHDIYYCYTTADANFTFTQIKERSLANNIPGIWHCNARDLIVWSRDQEPTTDGSAATSKNLYLVAGRDNTIKIYKADRSLVETVTTTVFIGGIVPINSTTLLVIGGQSEYDGKASFEIVSFASGTFTQTQKVFRADGGGQGIMCNSYAIDSNGIVYVAQSDFTNTPGTIPSRIFRFSSTDITATRPTITAVDTIPNLKVRGLFSQNGNVYLYGAVVDWPNAYNAIVKFPGTFVYKSTKANALHPLDDSIAFNYGVQTVFKGLTGTLFLSSTDLNKWDPLLEIQIDETIHEVAAFSSGSFDYDAPNPLAVAEWGGHFYLIRSKDQAVDRTGDSRGSFPSTYADMRLEFSDFGGNTQLINKTLYSVTVELSEAMPVSKPLYVDINGTNVGNIASTDGTRKEIVLASELTASSFRPTLRALYDNTWQGYVKRLILRYIPTQFKKKAWAFGVRATRNLRRIDGTFETKTPSTMVSDLWTAWSTNTPITFVDIDGTSYSVIVTDIDEREPLINRDSNKMEALVFLEVLEV